MTKLEMKELVKLQGEIVCLKRQLAEMEQNRDYEKDRAENAEFEREALKDKLNSFEHINEAIRNFLADECGMIAGKVWEKVPERFDILQYDYR